MTDQRIRIIINTQRRRRVPALPSPHPLAMLTFIPSSFPHSEILELFYYHLPVFQNDTYTKRFL